MTRPEPGSPPSAERLIFFTDAIAAIALTLLILPLLETVTGTGENVTLGRLIHGNVREFGSFVLSFAVIFRLWWSHHRTFEHVETLRPALVRANVIWAFAIVVLPISTAVIMAFPPSAGSVVLYGGTLALASGALTVLSLIVYRHPELTKDHRPGTREEVLRHVTAFGVQLLSTAIGAAFPDRVNYWAFLLMFLTSPVENLVKARWEKTRSA